ncbi:hypothetical protein AAFX60_006975 [Aliivibrio fischeri]
MIELSQLADIADELNSAERARTLQGRVLLSEYEELGKSMIKKSFAKDLEPVVKFMNLVSEEKNLQNELLMKQNELLMKILGGVE